MTETVDATTLRELTRALASTPACSDDAALLEEIRALEELKCAAEARQAALARSLTPSQATGAEVGIARRESHHRGRRHLSLARTVAAELPHLAAAWSEGRVSEWRTTLVARETACLSVEHRRQVDEELAADPRVVETMGDREVVAFCRRRAAALDVTSVVERRRLAEQERRVTIRPAPDTMVYLTALLPAAEGVAAYAALVRAADAASISGDPRGRGQVMADTLVAAVRASGPERRATPAVALNIVLTDRSLFAGVDDPAHLDGFGVIDAELVRELAHGDRVWLRRALADPNTGELVGLESRARRFPAGLRRLVRLRDHQCRTPWCSAPVRHVDHPTPASLGGPTTDVNSQGLCEACNHAKEAPGWWARPGPGLGHDVETWLPSGGRVRSRAPVIGGFRSRLSFGEQVLWEYVRAS